MDAPRKRRGFGWRVQVWISDRWMTVGTRRSLPAAEAEEIYEQLVPRMGADRVRLQQL
jgi:hypothetical protein